MHSSGSLPQPDNSDLASRCVFIADVAVYAFILVAGIFEITHYTRSADFLEDAGYVDLAHSLFLHGSYQINFLPETTLPPGFAFLLALVGRFFGFTPAALFPVIAVCATLGTVAAYELIRRVQGRGIAAVACLLFASSTTVFGYNTTGILPEMPYFLTSMLILLLALHIDAARLSKALIAWEFFLGALLALAVLIRSVGIALLIGLFMWSMVSWLSNHDAGIRRFRRFSIAIAFGLAAQLGWSFWAQRHQVLEWQLPGYPESYVSQLRVKDGNHPELGLARWSDIPLRVGENLVTRVFQDERILTGRYISDFWSSPAIAGVAILIIAGLASSFRAGGQLNDWYYLTYEGIFLLWPWKTEVRFLFPILPLACLYLWRGVQTLKTCLIRWPRPAGLCVTIMAGLLSASSGAFAFHLAPFLRDPGHVRADRVQPLAATLFWVIVAVSGLAWFGYHSLRDADTHGRVPERRTPQVRVNTEFALTSLAVALVALIVLQNTRQLIRRGQDNLHPNLTTQTTYPEIEAATWIRLHEPSDRVIMARLPEFIYHYTQRRVVWLPPIGSADVLMDGIQRLHVGVVVVVHHPTSYWIPPEEVCMQNLLQSYGRSFRLSHRGPSNWVYDVVSADGTSVANPSHSPIVSERAGAR